MHDAVKVRPARTSEVPTLARLVESRLPDMMAGSARVNNIESHLSGLVMDDALVVETRGTRLSGLGALDIDQHRILACYLDPEIASPDTPRRLFGKLESIALSFGIRKLKGLARARVLGFMKSIGYGETGKSDADDHIVVEKDLLADADADKSLLTLIRLCDDLGIPENYGVVHRMRLMPDATNLVEIGTDIYMREQRLIPSAADAWTRMRAAASNAGVELQLVSAFRSLAYQTNLVKQKLEDGHDIKRILRVSAPPGYSEHHSGRAIDLTTRGCQPLEEEFSQTGAYQWLKSNARFFGFRESYPRHNRHQIAWEPWHWYYFK